MSEFQQEIQARLASVQQSLAEARLEGDDYLVQVRLGELESLERIADENSLAS
jgi:hypothetical protein